MSISESLGGDIAATTSTDGQLNVFGSVTGYIASGDTDWYRVWLVTGRSYTVTMFGRDSPFYADDFPFDPFVSLLDANGVLLVAGSEDNLPNPDDSGLTYTPTRTGVYFVAASGFQDIGSYGIRLTTSGGQGDIAEDATTTARLTTAAPVSSQIEVATDADWLGLTLGAGAGYALNLTGTLPAPLISLFDGNGRFVAELANGQGFASATGGNYFVEIAGQSFENTGTYTATLKSVPTLRVTGANVDESAGAVVFTITLSQSTGSDVTLLAETLDIGTAAAGSDFVAKSQALTIPAGQTTATFTVQLAPDGLLEPTESVFVGLSNAFGAATGSFSVGSAQISDDDAGALVLPIDPVARQQWHLYPTVGANVLAAWGDYSGYGVRVAIFDQGIEGTLADLDLNVLVDAGRDAATLAVGGAPKLSTDNHGTAVAGVIAAERNGADGVGVAPLADLVSIYSPLVLADLVAGNAIANAYLYAKQFDILSDSWGFAAGGPAYPLAQPWALLDNFGTAAFADEALALRSAAEDGRGGLGTVVVESAGNVFGLTDDTNLHNLQNSRYVITVAATDYAGNASRYSAPGASVLVAAPGGGGQDVASEIWTTDRSGAAGYASGTTAAVSDASFAGPVVAGVVALMLEANPRLGYRDVQEILAYSAHLTAAIGNSWQYNGATDWNGGGLHFDAQSHNLGFGLVDARAAVRLAESWTTAPATAANDVEVSTTVSRAEAIPDGTSSLTQSVTVTQAVDIERVQVTIDLRHTQISDLALRLTSPSGTQSWLLSHPDAAPLAAFGSNQANLNFTFESVLHLGETSLGRWDLTVFDLETGDVGTLNSWTLNLVGKADSADDVYIYTDEFSDALLTSVARDTLTDTAGIDTLNASLVTTPLVIDLNPGRDSTIDGETLTLSSNTTIENAWGGDANDTLVGNSASNRLFGGRGNDTISGGGGLDIASYAGAKSHFTFSRSGSTWSVRDQTGAEGVDSVSSVERFHFADGALAVDMGTADSGGKAVLLLGAVLPGQLALDVSKEALMGVVIGFFDIGFTMRDLSGALLRLPVWDILAGSSTAPAIAQYLLTNVLGRAPDAATLAAGVTALTTEPIQGQWLANLALSAESQTHIGLVGLASTGVDFLVPG